jgi:hypothetical protein
MRTLLVGLAAALLSLPAPAQPDPSLGMAILPDPEVEPQPPSCGVGDTRALVLASPGSFDVLDPDGSLLGSFVVTSEQPIAQGLPAAVNAAEGSCDWFLSRGVFIPADQSAPVETGAVRSHATLCDPAGPILSISVATFIPLAVADANIAAVNSSSGPVQVLPEGDDPDPDPTPAGISLGSSCSCPACPLGGRIWIPFVVVGIGQVPGGRSCCASACDAACENLHRTGDPTQAWAAGQGIWVTCMICQ